MTGDLQAEVDRLAAELARLRDQVSTLTDERVESLCGYLRQAAGVLRDDADHHDWMAAHGGRCDRECRKAQANMAIHARNIADLLESATAGPGVPLPVRRQPL